MTTRRLHIRLDETATGEAMLDYWAAVWEIKGSWQIKRGPQQQPLLFVELSSKQEQVIRDAAAVFGLPVHHDATTGLWRCPAQGRRLTDLLRTLHPHLRYRQQQVLAWKALAAVVRQYKGQRHKPVDVVEEIEAAVKAAERAAPWRYTRTPRRDGTQPARQANLVPASHTPETPSVDAHAWWHHAQGLVLPTGWHIQPEPFPADPSPDDR